MSHADSRSIVKTYLVIFGALAVLTVITVGVSYLHLSKGVALAVGLSIAAVKAGLVAAYFMHLKGEKILIFGLLILTVAFLAVLMLVPIADTHLVAPEVIHSAAPAAVPAPHPAH